MRLIREHQAEPQPGVRDWSRSLLDRVPGWRRLDDVALPGAEADHVIGTPIGLLAVVSKWRPRAADAPARLLQHESDLATAASAGRRVRRLVGLAPNALDVPVYAVLLLWGPGNGAISTGWDETTGVFVLDASQPWAWPAELTASAPGDPEHRASDIDEALRKVHGWMTNHEACIGPRRPTVTLAAELRRTLRHHRPAADHRVAVRA